VCGADILPAAAVPVLVSSVRGVQCWQTVSLWSFFAVRSFSPRSQSVTHSLHMCLPVARKVTCCGVHDASLAPDMPAAISDPICCYLVADVCLCVNSAAAGRHCSGRRERWAEIKTMVGKNYFFMNQRDKTVAYIVLTCLPTCTAT